MNNAANKVDRVVTYLGQVVRASRIVFDRAWRAGDRATGYHQLLLSAAVSVEREYSKGGEPAVRELEAWLAGNDAAPAMLSEVRRLRRAIIVRE